MLELSVGVIGMGNHGGQVATITASGKYNIPSVALNASNNDLLMVTNATTFQIGNAGRGTGKSRNLSKELMETGFVEIMEEDKFIEVVEKNDIIVVVGSLGGGFGSGSVPSTTMFLRAVYSNKVVIPCFTFPSIDESLAAQQHALEFLEELAINMPDVSYMVYDNDKYRGLPQAEIFRKVNEDIAIDIYVIQGSLNYATNLSSIDENDMLRMLSKPGRIVVGRLDDLQLKDIDKNLATTLRSAINHSGQADLETNPALVESIGFICNLDNKFQDYVTPIIKDLQDEFGECVEDYSHIRTKDENEEMSDSAYVILSGWDIPHKRVESINNKKKEAEALLLSRQRKNLVNTVDTEKIDALRNTTTRGIGDTNAKQKVDIASLMQGFKRA